MQIPSTGVTPAEAQKNSDHRELHQVELLTGIAAGLRSASPTVVEDALPLRLSTGAMGAGIGIGAAWAVDSAAQSLDRHTDLDRWQTHAIAAGAGIGTMLLTKAPAELTLAQGIARSGAKGFAFAGTAGLAVDGYRAIRGPRESDSTPDFIDRHRKAIAGVVGAGVAVGVGMLAKKFVPMMRNSSSIGALMPGEDAVGAALGETIPRSKQSGFGRLFLRNRTEGLEHTPGRSYIPLELDGLSMTERNAKGVEDWIAQGGLEHDKVVLHVTTGTGDSNPAPIGFDERASNGKTAWIAFQYSDRASIFSLSRTQDGVDQLVDLIEQTRAAIDARYPDGNGPKIYVAATSLGALVIENAIHQQGARIFDELGVYRAVHLGQPEEISQMKVSDLPWGQIGRFHDLDAVAGLTQGQVDAMRVMEYAHPEDPVRTMSMRYLVVDPQFSRERPRPDWVPPGYRNTPIVSWFRHGMDTAQAIDRGTDDTVSAIGHDYRGDMYPFVNRAFDHNLPEDRVTALGTLAAADAARIARQVREQVQNGTPTPPPAPPAP